MEKKQMNLYDCASLFAETMNERFPHGSENCGIIMFMSDGKKYGSLVDGDDGLLKQIMANVAQDEDLSALLCEGLVKGIEHRIRKEEGNDAD